MPVIDIHPHIVSPDTKRYPLAPLGGTQSTWSSERPTTYQTLLAAMDDAGIDKAAIVHSATAYGYDDSYVADAVAAVPSRCTGVYSIDVMAPDAVKTFDYWLGRGCTGMRLFTTGSTLPDQATWFVDPKTYPFWEHAAAKNHSGLHADEAGRLTAAAPDHGSLRFQIELPGRGSSQSGRVSQPRGDALCLEPSPA